MSAPHRFSQAGLLLAATALVIGIGASFRASAHHPGSHASRAGDGSVRLDAVAQVTDSCTRIKSVGLGAPPQIRVPADSEPVTISLDRPADTVCAEVVGAAQAQAVLQVPSSRQRLQIYILRPDGTLAGSERVPIR